MTTTSPSARRLAGQLARTSARVVAEAKRLRLTTDELPTLKLPWFQVYNALEPVDGDPDGVDTGRSDVFIFDEIGGSMGVDANALIAEIQNIDGPLNVRINSPGGSVFDALAIRSALEHHPHDVRVYVDGIAASAASVLALAGNEVVMMPGSQLMIHDASAPDSGNPEDHRNMATFLDRQSDNIADLYRIKGGGTVDEWRAAMQDETWYFAQEAVDAGLADRVWKTDTAETAAVLGDGETADLMTRSFDLSHYRYAGRPSAPPPGSRPRIARASVRDRERAPMSRAAAAQERARAFATGTPVSMPDLSTRTQTRGHTIGLGETRRVPFHSGLRATLDTSKGKDLYHVHGYATVFGKPYDMWDSFGEYEEVIVRGAADRTLAMDPDVAFLANHEGVTMARTTNGTLSLVADSVGLVSDAWLNPNRRDVADLISAIEDELITEMSFAFMIPEGGGLWSEDFTRFEIRAFDINRGDVSAVNYGASPWTSIASRAREVLVHAKDLPEGMQRALVAKLGTPLNRRVRQAAATDLGVVETRLLSEPPTPTQTTVPAAQGRKLSLIEDLLKE
jgi:HK97 family phage prohead protease